MNNISLRKLNHTHLYIEQLMVSYSSFLTFRLRARENRLRDYKLEHILFISNFFLYFCSSFFLVCFGLIKK